MQHQIYVICCSDKMLNYIKHAHAIRTKDNRNIKIVRYKEKLKAEYNSLLVDMKIARSSVSVTHFRLLTFYNPGVNQTMMTAYIYFPLAQTTIFTSFWCPFSLFHPSLVTVFPVFKYMIFWILYRYIMFGRGICEKYLSGDEISGNFSSLNWYFSQIPLPNIIYLFNYTEYYLEHWLNK